MSIATDLPTGIMYVSAAAAADCLGVPPEVVFAEAGDEVFAAALRPLADRLKARGISITPNYREIDNLISQERRMTAGVSGEAIIQFTAGAVTVNAGASEGDDEAETAESKAAALAFIAWAGSKFNLPEMNDSALSTAREIYKAVNPEADLNFSIDDIRRNVSGDVNSGAASPELSASAMQVNDSPVTIMEAAELLKCSTFDVRRFANGVGITPEYLQMGDLRKLSARKSVQKQLDEIEAARDPYFALTRLINP